MVTALCVILIDIKPRLEGVVISITKSVVTIYKVMTWIDITPRLGSLVISVITL